MCCQSLPAWRMWHNSWGKSPIYGLKLHQGRFSFMRKEILSLRSGQELEWAAQRGGGDTGSVQEESGCGTWGDDDGDGGAGRSWRALPTLIPWLWDFGMSGARPWCATGISQCCWRGWISSRCSEQLPFPTPSTVEGLNSAKIPPQPQIPTPLRLGWFYKQLGVAGLRDSLALLGMLSVAEFLVPFGGHTNPHKVNFSLRPAPKGAAPQMND